MEKHMGKPCSAAAIASNSEVSDLVCEADSQGAARLNSGAAADG